jgi:hypothetical protein
MPHTIKRQTHWLPSNRQRLLRSLWRKGQQKGRDWHPCWKKPQFLFCVMCSKKLHVCLSSVIDFPGYGSGTSMSKIVVCIAATAKLWIQGMDYDQCGPATPFKNKLALTYVLLQSLWLNFSPVANVGLSGSNRNKQEQNSGGHCSNHQIVNSGHGLWSI